MAAELTDHIWSLEELLSYRVPPPMMWLYSPGHTETRNSRII
jgi:hypothetical protein